MRQVRYLLVGGFAVLLHKDSLVAAKKQSGRPADVGDLENLGA